MGHEGTEALRSRFLRRFLPVERKKNPPATRIECCYKPGKTIHYFCKLFVGTLLVTFSNKMNKD